MSNFEEDEDTIIMTFDALKFSGFAGGNSYKILNKAI